MSTAVKRACDACHRRKVKCDGINPCRNCSSAQLSCTYNAIPQKKGPKGSRAKVISELRETQRQSSLSAKIQNRINGGGASTGTVFAPTPGLLTNEMVKACIDFFFANMYPTMPILNRQRLEQDAMSMDTTLDTYCLLTSLSAFMMLQPGISIPGADPYGLDGMPGATIVTANLLLEETVRIRKGYDYIQNPTLHTIATSYFIFACYYGLDLQDKAWFNLREATSLVHLVRMNKDEAYSVWDKVEASRRRRLFWLLFVVERAYALQHDRPLSLKASISTPTPADDPSDPHAHKLLGFCHLAQLFRPFDNSFVDLWNKTRGNCSASYLAALQKQQTDVFGALAAADPQIGDTMRNQQWLKSVAWQINLAQGKAACNGNDVPAYQYSMLDVSREVIPMAASFSPQGSNELLHSGLVETLLTVTSELTTVLSMLPSSSNPFTLTPRDHLSHISNILAVIRIGEHRFTPLLLAKVHEVLPRLANPMLQAPSETSCEMDIFDGFGNAGMAQTPCLTVDDYKVEGINSTAASSLHDINSPFVSSPPILSPGMDFNTHGLSTDFTPLPDISIHQQIVAGTLPSVPSVPSVGGRSHTVEQTPSPPQPQLQLQLQALVPQQKQRQQQDAQQQQQEHHQHQPQPPQHHHHHQHQQHQHHHGEQQEQHLPQQHDQQQLQHLQHLQQQQSASVLHGQTQAYTGNPQVQSQMNRGMVSTSPVGVTIQPIDQPQRMSGVLSNQAFTSSIGVKYSGLNGSGLVLRQQPQQQSSSFGIPAQQIRTVGDFQALQRANSDLSSLNPLVMNSLGVDFGL